mgnify:CR=1 FL=1
MDIFLNNESEFLTDAIKNAEGKLRSVKFVKRLTGLGLKESKMVVMMVQL